MYGKTQNHKSVKHNFRDIYNQSLTIKANKQIDLGTINGKPFNMKIFKDGGFEWSGGPLIRCHSGNKVTPEDVAAAYATNSYTRIEHEQAQKVLGVINQIYQIANRGQPTTTFNDFISTFKISPEEVENALNCLGFNTSKPFTLNGRTFVLSSGVLKDYEKVK